MKASPEHQALLLDLQAIDTKVSQLDHRAASLPQLAELAALTTHLDTVRAATAQFRGAVEDARLELTRLESDVALVEQRVSRDKDRLQTSSSPKDVAALEQELAALAKRQFDLEEIELTVMEKVEEREAELTGSLAQLEELEAKRAAIEADRDAALSAIANEKAEALADRRAIATTVPDDLLALYDKQQKRYGFGATLLRFGVSSVTGVALLADELQSIRAAAPDDVLICPSSDAILVRTSESGL
jgi:predicted  nucleic acid-binding Zn-ribbon protein